MGVLRYLLSSNASRVGLNMRLAESGLTKREIGEFLKAIDGEKS